MTAIDDFYRLIAQMITQILVEHEAALTERTRWIVVQDESGIELTAALPSSRPAHEILAGLLDHGAAAAAFVSYFPSSPERVFAQVYVANPATSDVRRASVRRSPVAPVALGAWESTV